jgi:hypothetical protein
MKRIAYLGRIGAAASFVVALASACGGQSFTPGDGGEGGSNNAGTTPGGSTNHAGTFTTAGKSHGGTSSAGSGMGGAVTAGAGGIGGDAACSALPETGPCDALIQRWYHDPASGQCYPFVWGGCGGNANRYDSQAACEAACPGPVNVFSCKVPSDCMLTTPSCCGVCDSPNLTTQNFVSYNKNYAGLPCGVTANTIPIGGSGAGFPNPGGSPGVGAPVACPSCPVPAPGTGTLKYFVPDCVMGQCVVDDLRTSAVTACKTNTDCKLRNGTGCCEGCGGDDYVAVRKDGSFEKLVCGGLQPPCAACLPQPPINAVAWCDVNVGHCQVEYAIGGAPGF